MGKGISAAAAPALALAACAALSVQCGAEAPPPDAGQLIGTWERDQGQDAAADFHRYVLLKDGAGVAVHHSLGANAMSWKVQDGDLYFFWASSGMVAVHEYSVDGPTLALSGVTYTRKQKTGR